MGSREVSRFVKRDKQSKRETLMKQSKVASNDVTRISLPESFRPIQMRNPIRIGSVYDGGYVLPQEVVAHCENLLSFGINLDWTFEQDFLRRFPKSKVRTFDYTTRFSYVLWWCVTRFCYAPISRKRQHWLAPLLMWSFLRFRSHKSVEHTPKFVGNQVDEKFTNVDGFFRV